MTVNLEELMEAQFIMRYYGHMSDSDFDELPTYEFRAQMALLARQKKREADAQANAMQQQRK